MKTTTIIIISGTVLLFFSFVNILASDFSYQSYQRAEVISSISSLIIIAIGLIYKQIQPDKPKKVELKGEQVLIIDKSLSMDVKEELAWGSKLILTATPASTMILIWEDKIFLKRGICANTSFTPGRVCKNSIKQNKLISLANTSNYPDSYEFDSIVPNLPSVIVAPIQKSGYLIIGGWTKRCFSKSDEILIKSWAEKIESIITS